MAAINPTTSVANWNRSTKHVEVQTRTGRYISADSVLIAAAPPRIADMSAAPLSADLNAASVALGANKGRDAIYPIGLIEQISVQQQQMVQKIFEIGSRRSYQVGGRTQVAGSLGRVMFRGTSLLRAMYAFYPNKVGMANGKVLGRGGLDDVVSNAIYNGYPDGPSNPFPEIFFAPGSFTAPDREDPAGVPAAFFGNLMSDLFAHPIGLVIILRDNNNDNYAAMYLEDTMVTTHSLNINSASALVTEAVTFQSDACVPMEFSTDFGARITPLPG